MLTRDRCALGRGHDGEIGKPRTFHAFSQHAINETAGDRADQVPDNTAGWSERGAACRGVDN